jgi:hypothetical protein
MIRSGLEEGRRARKRERERESKKEEKEIKNPHRKINRQGM